MNKLKKILVSLPLAIAGIFSKVYNVFAVQPKYGVIDPNVQLKYGVIEDKYGVFDPLVGPKYEPTIWDKILSVGKFIIPVILFLIGLFVLLNKKITKKVKVITISAFILIAIVCTILINYIQNIN